MRKDDVVSLLGEGFLLALKRAVPDSLVAAKIHGLIKKMPDEDWEAILDFVNDCIKPALSDCETIFPPKEDTNNKRLRLETGEDLFEKRGHKWALTGFGFETWGNGEKRRIDVDLPA